MKATLLSILSIGLVHFLNGQTWDDIQTLYPEPTAEINEEFGHDLAINGNLLVVGSPFNDRLGEDVGLVTIYEFKESGWELVEEILPSVTQEALLFGYSVDIEGSRIAIGSPGANLESGTGHVTIYEFQESWVQIGQINSHLEDPDDRFGEEVLFSEEDLLIGAPGAFSQTDHIGAAFVYDFDTDWTLIATLTGGLDEFSYHGDDFGERIEEKHGKIFISSPGADASGGNTGVIYYFDRPSEAWFDLEIEDGIYPSNPRSNDLFGKYFHIGDDFSLFSTARSGVFKLDSESGVHLPNNSLTEIFSNTSSNDIRGIGIWGIHSVISFEQERVIQVIALNSENEVAFEFKSPNSLFERDLGNKMIEQNGYILLSDPTHDSFVTSGSIHVYHETNILSQEISPSQVLANPETTLELESLGTSVAISGDYAISGSPTSWYSEYFTGTAYVFKKENGIWEMYSRLASDQPEQGDNYGISTAIDGNLIAVGANNKNRPELNQSGEVYLYDLSESNWDDYSNPVKLSTLGYYGKYFGWDISIYKSRVLVSSMTTNAYPFNGRVFSFIKSNDQWQLEGELSTNESVNWYGQSVSLYEDRALVASNEKLFLFEHDGDNWNQLVTLERSEGSIHGAPIDVVLKDSLAVAGIRYPRDESSQLLSSEILEFDLSGNLTGVLNETRSLGLSESYETDQFGESIDLSGFNLATGLTATESNNRYGFLFDTESVLNIENHVVAHNEVISSAPFKAAIDRGTVLIGAPSDNTVAEIAGAVHFIYFDRNEVNSVSGITGIYKIDDVVEIEVNFDNNVDVTGQPSLLLDLREHGFKKAQYISGNGSNTLKFQYIVSEGDSSAHLNYYNQRSMLYGGEITSDLTVDRLLPTTNSSNSLSGTSLIQIDGIRPLATLSTTFGDSINSSFDVQVIVSESILDLESEDFTITNGSITEVNMESPIPTVTIEPNSEGEVIIQLKEQSFTDIAGNYNSQASNTLIITYDITPPQVTLVASIGDTVDWKFNLDFVFSEQIRSLEPEDIIADGATVESISKNGLIYSALIKPINEGYITFQLPESAVMDYAGNGNLLSDEFVTVYDTLPPILNNTGWLDIELTQVPSPILELVDLDNDGDLDLISGQSIFEFQDGHFNPKELELQSYSRIQISDFNFDGFVDLLTEGIGMGIRTYYNNGNFTFDQIDLYSISESSDFGPGFYLLDIDHDGAQEVLTTQSNFQSNHQIVIMEHDGSSWVVSRFLGSGQFAGLGYPFADLDGDGDIDFISISDDCDNFIRVHKNDGQGLFTMHTTTISGLNPSFDTKGRMIWGDYNEQSTDERLDLVLVGKNNCNTYDGVFSFLYSFGDTFRVDLSADGALKNSNINTGAIQWGDFDLDGDLDLFHSIALNEGIGKGGILTNGNFLFDGTEVPYNHFLPTNHLELGNSDDNSSLAIGDIDGDGDLDAVFVEPVAASLNYRMIAYQNMLIEDFKKDNDPPQPPSNLKVIQSGENIEFKWDPPLGDLRNLTYNFILYHENEPIISVNSQEDGRRLLPEMGNAYKATSVKYQLPIDGTSYTWGVQAVDNTFRGSQFAYFDGEVEPQPVLSISNSRELIFWPNPVSNTLNIRNNSGSKSSLEIITLSGRVILSTELSSGLNEIDVSELNSGLHFIIFNDLKSQVHRFIKE